MSNFSLIRLKREIVIMNKDETKDYFVYQYPDQMNKLVAIINGPKDSLYAYKFIRLEIEVLDTYPSEPPKVKFTNYVGYSRVHPNLYANGKVCLSILGTWQGPKWTSVMSIDTVLVSIQSLLDNTPYCHEPGQSDNKQYNEFVFHDTFYTCLKEYIECEPIEECRMYMINKTLENYSKIVKQLEGIQSGVVCSKKYNSSCNFDRDILKDFLDGLMVSISL